MVETDTGENTQTPRRKALTWDSARAIFSVLPCRPAVSSAQNRLERIQQKFTRSMSRIGEYKPRRSTWMINGTHSNEVTPQNRPVTSAMEHICEFHIHHFNRQRAGKLAPAFSVITLFSYRYKTDPLRTKTSSRLSHKWCDFSGIVLSTVSKKHNTRGISNRQEMTGWNGVKLLMR